MWKIGTMNYTITTENAAEHKLIKSKSDYGLIRRDPIKRVAQIYWMRESDGKGEWIDITNYRYGMNSVEYANDVVATNIDEETWNSHMIEVRTKDTTEHNMKKWKRQCK